MPKEELFDVIEVNIKDRSIRMMGENKTLANAEAIERFALMRRGNDENFFTIAPAGKYTEGSKYLGGESP